MVIGPFDPDQFPATCKNIRCRFDNDAHPSTQKRLCGRCETAGLCLVLAGDAYDYHDFLTRDLQPSLKHIVKMIDDGAPIEHVRIELEALRQRVARTV